MLETILEQAVRNSTLAWIRVKKIKNEKGNPINLEADSPHFFLRDVYEDTSQEIVVQKPSQIGVSTWAILDEIHDARYWGINQIHTLPASKDVQQFVPSKVNEIINNNSEIRAGMSKKDVDAIDKKQFGKGFLFFKGTKGDSDTLMLSSDKNVYDELDASDQSKIGAYESRLEGESSLRKKRYISTPTIPGFGVNLKFQESDQKHWRFNCGHCNHEQHMEWPANIDMDRAVYICSNCGKDLDPKWIRPKNKATPEGTGRWKAKFPGRKVSGYQMTQMIAPWIKPEDLVRTYKDAENGRNDMTLEYFYNHKLGQPYVTASSQIPKNLILQNCINREHLELNSCMGVDVQLHELYIMLGSEEGIYGIVIARDTPEYIETNGKKGKSKWDRWAELMEIYDVRYCIIDGGFTPNDVITNALKFPGRVWVNWYKDNPKKGGAIVRFSDDNFTEKQKDQEEEIKVLTERDRALDMLLAGLKVGTYRFFYHPDDEAIKNLIKHVETTYARTVTDRKGNLSREWVSTGKDDFLHALVYFMIAIIRKRRTES